MSEYTIQIEFPEIEIKAKTPEKQYELENTVSKKILAQQFKSLIKFELLKHAFKLQDKYEKELNKETKNENTR